VENLTRYYKDIVASGARLILVTPKPLETTRRVARFFEVEFDFWLDDSLEAAEKLGLLHTAAVPTDYRREYGADTVWPTALVVDRNGIIRHTELSRHISDRPDPKVLLRALQQQ
jgi:peroxiredoxin